MAIMQRRARAHTQPSNDPEYGRIALDMVSGGLYDSLTKEPVGYGDGIGGKVARTITNNSAKAYSAIPVAGPFITGGIEAGKMIGNTVKGIRASDGSAEDIAGSILGNAGGASSIISGLSSGVKTDKFDRGIMVDSPIGAARSRTYVDEKQPVLLAEAGMKIDNKQPDYAGILKSQFTQPSTSMDFHKDDTRVTKGLGVSDNSSIIGGDEIPLIQRNPFKVGEGPISDRFERSAMGTANTSAIFNAGSMLAEIGYLAAIAGDKHTTSQRPETIDPVDPRVPMNAIRSVTGLRTDKYFNSALRESRESGKPLALGDVLENENALNAQTAQYLSSILNDAQKTNVDVQAKNASILASFRDSIDMMRMRNQSRKDQILGALVSAPNKYAQTTLNNYANTYSKIEESQTR